MELTPEEARVLGCLIEKEMTTPDNYPLSSNALVNACNQSTSRDPIVHYTEREVDQVVVEHGTLPIDDLYRELKPLSRNDGAVDYDKLINGGVIFPARSEGNFDLVRIGDAVHARNIHAAIYDGLRYATRF